MSKVLVFSATSQGQAACQSVITAIENLAMAFAENQVPARIVDRTTRRIYGVRNGQAVLEAPTTNWGVPKQNPANEWWCHSLTGTQFAAGMDDLAPLLATLTYRETDLLDSWL
jgi:hypothetical protein